jgi:E3 ubiquitin-protein ligase listerin
MCLTCSHSVDTLAEQALQLWKAHDGADRPAFSPASLLPDLTTWTNALKLFLQDTLDPSLSLTSSLGGAYFLTSGSQSACGGDAEYDVSGLSLPGRMASYTIKLLAGGLDLKSLSSADRANLVVSLGITAEMVEDQLSTMTKGRIWNSLRDNDSASKAENLVSSTRRTIGWLAENASGWRDGSDSDESRLVFGIMQTLLEATTSFSAVGIYSAKVLSDLLQSLADKHGFPSSAEIWLTGLDVFKASPATALSAIALLTGLGETLSGSKVVSNFFNRLLSDVAGASVETERSLVVVVLLNACMPIYETGELPAAMNRLVFAVRQIVSWLETPENLDYRFATEACRSLRLLLPCIKDTYGPYWDRAIDFCLYLWTQRTEDPLEHRLPAIHASLRLIAALQSIENGNDDLVEALQSNSDKLAAGLLELLKLPRQKDTQATEIVDSIVCRRVEALPVEKIIGLSELYGLVASDSRTIQTAAFMVLHKALPAAQEQLSVDILLDKKTAQLPDELLSLLLDAPTLEAYSDDALARFPTAIRSYLLSWHLVFDAFDAAAFKVRGDYADNLKTANYIGPLMDFTFDVLGHSAAHGLNLDKANFSNDDIRAYDLKLADSESDERNMQWLLIHLYYLVLKHIPGLFKAWFIDCRSKQTKIAVESWMAKYFSPLIISDLMDDVAKWADMQEPPADDEKELMVKVSRAAKEVTAGYEVDELQATIAIKVPPAYPVEGVSVIGVNRVAVNEKKWQSWIMATQGIITFSVSYGHPRTHPSGRAIGRLTSKPKGGSIIDGLSAFRRNVVGALKGQSECAICYSIISSDKKMPDKRCSTCKNLFHRTCLYKWFQSSNQNTCPLCRNPIDYLGADTKARRA